MLLRGRPASASGMPLVPSPANPTGAPQGRRRPHGPVRGGARRPAAFRRICAIAVAAAIPALAGCEAGMNAPVLQWHPPVNGVNKTLTTVPGSGFLGIRDLFVLGPVPGGSFPAGSSAGAFLALDNTGPRDRLLSITAPGTATSVTLPGGSVAVPDGPDRAADRAGARRGAERPDAQPDRRDRRADGAALPERGHREHWPCRCWRRPITTRPTPPRRPRAPHRREGSTGTGRAAGSAASPSPGATPTPTPTATP